MKIEPILDRVAVKREVKRKSKGGIILPDNEKRDAEYGEVVAVGPGGFNMDGSRRDMGIKKSDIVFFDNYHVTTVKSNIVIVDEQDVLAIVRDK